MQTTLKEIKKFGPCVDGWKTLLKYLGKTKCDDEPISFTTLLNAVGIEDAIWCLRAKNYLDYCLFVADVAESVLPIFEERYPDDDRPRKAIAAIRAYKKGEINLISLKDANAASFAAADAADAAADTAANAAAHAAYAAAEAVAFAAYAAADTAAYVAAEAAAEAVAYAAVDTAADSAAEAVAFAAAEKEKCQEIEFLFIKYFI